MSLASPWATMSAGNERPSVRCTWMALDERTTW